MIIPILFCYLAFGFIILAGIDKLYILVLKEPVFKPIFDEFAERLDRDPFCIFLMISFVAFFWPIFIAIMLKCAVHTTIEMLKRRS